MDINVGNLKTVYTGFNAAYARGLARVADPRWSLVATKVPSSTATNEYGWLGSIPGVREWLGERYYNNLLTHAYAIRNRTWENTIRVPRENIEDDQVGLFAPAFEMLGQNIAVFPDKLTFAALLAGFTTPCYDNQNFFDPAHPVGDSRIGMTTVGNTDAVAGNGPAWFLTDSSAVVKPIIFQERRPFMMVAKDRPDDDNVFERNEFVYGADGRMNVGYGFWQFTWGSKQPLNTANYAYARAQLMAMRKDNGDLIGVMPDTLVVSPGSEGAGRQVVINDRNAAGAANEWAGTAKLEVVNWLAQ